MLMSIVLLFSVSTWFSASAVILQLRTLWELNPTTSAWLTIAVQVGFVCGAIIFSLFNLADILAPRHIILGCAVGAAIANLLLNMADGPAVGIPLRFATGFFVAGIYPPAFKLISTWFREGRGLALGILGGRRHRRSMGQDEHDNFNDGNLWSLCHSDRTVLRFIALADPHHRSHLGFHRGGRLSPILDHGH